MRSRRVRAAWAALALAWGAFACEPSDTPGGRLTSIELSIAGSNPGTDGRYRLVSGQRVRVRAEGRYDSGRSQDVSLALFFKLEPANVARLDCQSDPVAGNQVILEGVAPGEGTLSASTREATGSLIPCVPTPDGGFYFPDGGSDWPLSAPPLLFRVAE
ncbi:MAG: hypothetical protein GYA21_02825 [Myxococcales bacterium]|nr:hypothetical protein [Myxococcales bacterium]